MGRSSVARAVLVSTRNLDVFVSRSSVAMGRSSVAGAVLVSTRNLDVLVSRSSVGFEKFLWYSVPLSPSQSRPGHQEAQIGSESDILPGLPLSGIFPFLGGFWSFF